MDKSKKDIYFKGIPLVAFKDKNLSRTAKMIYYEMYYYVSTTSLRVTPEFLLMLGKDSRYKFFEAWNELKRCGYVKKYTRVLKEENSGFDYRLCEYDILDKPDTLSPYNQKITSLKEL